MWLVPTSSRTSNLSKVFDGVLEDLFDTTSSWLESSTKFLVDVEDTDKAFLVKAELPGMDKKDINVSVMDDVLTISAERKYEKKKSSYYERRIGKFERSFTIDTGIDKENIGAEYKDGVLYITLNKTVIPKKDMQKIEIR